jgi:hypothetical protein
MVCVWKGVGRDVAAMFQDCQQCQKGKVHKQPAIPLHAIPVPARKKMLLRMRQYSVVVYSLISAHNLISAYSLISAYILLNYFSILLIISQFIIILPYIKRSCIMVVHSLNK